MPLNRQIAMTWIIWLAAWLLWAGAAPACSPPNWWGKSAAEDSFNWYFEGSGTSRVSADEALAEARRNALAQAIARLGAGLSDEVQMHLLGRAQGWEERDKWVCKQWNTYQGWARIRYPTDQFEALGAYAQGGEDQFNEATGLVAQQRYSDALEMIGSLTARYPLGQQPLFQTERALLLASDCHQALGRPRQALQTCDSVLAGSDDPGFRQEAQNRQAAIRQNYTNLLYRGIFNGRTFLVRGISELDGRPGLWSSMQKEMENLVKQSGGRVQESTSPSPADWLERMRASAGQSIMQRGIPADGVLVAITRGEMKHSLVNTDAGPRDRYDFNGTVRIILEADGQLLHAWEHSGTFWYPISPAACLDFLASTVLPKWWENLAAQVDQ